MQQIILWGQELFHQKICAEGETIFLTDTGAAAVQIVSPTEALADFLKHNSMLHTSHGIHSNLTPDLLTVISTMEEAVSYFEEAITAARARIGGRMSAEGPHGVPSSKAILRTRMTLEALKRIQREIEAVHRDYVCKVNVKALVILLIEHFNSKMRFIYDMRTVQQFCSQFCAAVEKLSKESVIVASAILPRDTRIMMFPMRWLSLKSFQRFLVPYRRKDAKKIWKRSSYGLELMTIAHDSFQTIQQVWRTSLKDRKKKS